MAIVDTRICKGALSDANATLYTSPSGTKTLVKSLNLCNTSASAVTVTIKLAGTEILAGKSIEANSNITLSVVDQMIDATELIEGSASTASVVTYYMTGKQIM